MKKKTKAVIRFILVALVAWIMIFNMTLTLFEPHRETEEVPEDTEQDGTDSPTEPEEGTEGGAEDSGPSSGSDADVGAGSGGSSGGGTSSSSNEPSVEKRITSAEITDFNKISFKTTAAPIAEDIKVYSGESEILISSVSEFDAESLTGVIVLAESVDLTRSYRLVIDGYGEREAIPTDVFDTEQFINSYTYSEDDLGATYDAGVASFKLWAPTAIDVTLNLYASAESDEGKACVQMTKGSKGVWSCTASCASGTYYTYTVTTVLGANEVTDPYATASNKNATRNMVTDISLTNPDGWKTDFTSKIASYNEAIICEISVDGFSSAMAESAYKGKYLAFTEQGLVNKSGSPIGIDYLKSVGITHVRLVSVTNGTAYNAPRAEYATSDDPSLAIKEFKAMILALHNAGIGVIIDLDYSYSDGEFKNLEKIVPYYYQRSADGGDSARAQSLMYQKLIGDSVEYWMSEYGVDGFCLTNMSRHDRATVEKIESTAHLIDKSAVIMGKCAKNDTPPVGVTLADYQSIGKIKKTNGAVGSVAVLSCDLEAAITGANNSGYLTGSAASYAAAVAFGMSGGASANGNLSTGVTLVNYLGSQSTATLWNKLIANDAGTNISAAYLGAALLMSSRGAVMYPLGDEFLNTGGSIDWSMPGRSENADLMSEYFISMLKLRDKFKILTDGDVEAKATVYSDGVVVILLSKTDGGRMLIISNPTSEVVSQQIDSGWYAALKSNVFSDEPLNMLCSTVESSPYTVTIVVNDQAWPKAADPPEDAPNL